MACQGGYEMPEADRPTYYNAQTPEPLQSLAPAPTDMWYQAIFNITQDYYITAPRDMPIQITLSDDGLGAVILVNEPITYLSQIYLEINIVDGRAITVAGLPFGQIYHAEANETITIPRPQSGWENMAAGIALTDKDGMRRYFGIWENANPNDEWPPIIIWELPLTSNWRQAAVELLSTMDSLFTRVAWLCEGDEETEIFFPYGAWRFFDRQGNRIEYAPWIYATQYTQHFADYFRIFDFDGDGIPEILIHFHQTFEGCYGGFYRIFRYTNGAYHMLEISAYAEGELLPWVNFGNVHQIFIDGYGRTITLIDSELSGMEYAQLVLAEGRAKLNQIPLPHWTWEEWREHHWIEWDYQTWEIKDSWLNHNPTIFGTDIPLTPLQPLTDLGNQLFKYAQNLRGM